jgi:hypothetical protein
MRKQLVAVMATLAWACTDSSGPPPPVPTSQLHFVVQDTLAPPLLAAADSFYAKVGQDRQLELFYQGAAPGDTGETFLRFEVKGNSLLKRPNGTAFQANDSILITVSVADPTRFDFTFGPAGLQFNPAQPAKLHVEYNHSNHDFNEDGHVDGQDDATETKLNVWRREAADTVWTRMGTAKNESLDEIESQIISFTQYAVAW